MRLKKLELLGFKSFADRTEIIFDEGVTCIVGPNGCGKSNISDSIRWVLGERSAKLLRGAKMEDVIFNGTDFRKPTALAEVSLTIDNTDRGLPIEYNEVTLTRRLYRSGESEYLINKTVCRLKDIQDLILDTGIGSSSYSMIEQGRIDYILNADADERRFLIEEAAGISKYKVKKEEAIRKLERTEENRLRLNDIIHEVQKNIQYAERQAQRAAKYQQELEKLKNLELARAFTELARLTSEKNTLNESRSTIHQRIAELTEKIETSKTDQEALNSKLQEIAGHYHEEESRRFGFQSKWDQNQQQLGFNQEKRLEMAARRGQIEQEELQLNERIKKSEEEVASKRHELSLLDIEQGKAAEALKTSEDTLQKIESEIQSLRATIEKVKAEAFQSASKIAQVRNEYHRVNAFLESSQEQKKKSEAGSERLKQETQGWESKKLSAQQQSQLLIERLAQLDEQKNTLENEIEQSLNQRKEEEKSLSDLERSLHEKQTRLSLLIEIDEAARASESAILTDLSEEDRNLTHTLRELLTVQQGFEWALESALDTFARSFVAENFDIAKKLTQKMSAQKSIAMGLLIQSSPQNPTAAASQKPSHPQISKALTDVVQIKAGYEPVFGSFLQNVYLADQPLSEFNIEELLQLSQSCKILTPDGFTLGHANQIFFHNSGLTSEDNFFKRNAEITALNREVQQTAEQLILAKQSLTAREAFAAELQKKKETVESEHLDSMIKKESFESLLSGMQERIVSYQRELELTGFEYDELQTQYEAGLAQQKVLEARLQECETFETQIRARQDELSKTLETSERGRSDAVKLLAETHARFETYRDRTNFLTESVNLLLEHDGRDRSRLNLLAEELEKHTRRLEELDKEDLEVQSEQEKIQSQLRDCEVAVEIIRQEKEAVEKQLGEARDHHQTLLDEERSYQGKLHQFEIKEMDLNFQEKTIYERMEQTYRIQLSTLKPEDYSMGDLAPEQLEEKINHLKQRVESLGTVNLLAIEEYEELKQRYDFLMTQQKDLDDAREQLMETIRKINRTTKGLFEETFANVQKTFQEYYETLFRGGQAKLVLVDESNPLESGIDIHVRPPGKKLQHISLLSGGEKALTASALLFALFKIKPSPFCVLDEVDAPLDEANVDRFIAVLKTFLESSQFIIVTHNRKTIAMGDALYGVTMQEAGVSKLVSVKVNPTAKTAEPAQTEPETNSEQAPVNA